MYRSLYNLKSRPFEIEPDPLFLWLGERHKETLFFLRYGILDNMGFLFLAGEEGTGKTTLINGLARGLKSDVEWAVISNLSHDSLEFYNEIVAGFGLDVEFTSKVEFFIQFSHFLHKAYGANKKVVLFVDDCHLLSQEILDELRLLSNIQKGDAKLIDIFFVGQPEFAGMLAVPCNHSIQEQLALKAKLVPFSVNETGHYIRHRLKVAGVVIEIFTSRAVQQIHAYSQGVAREINVICDRALKAGASLGEKVIDEKLIVLCMEEPDKFVEDDRQQNTLTAEYGTRASTEEVDDRATPDVAEVKKGGRWLSYVMLFLVCAGVGVYFSPVRQKLSSVLDMVNGGTTQKTAVISEHENVESQKSEPEIVTAIIEPAPLKGSLENDKNEMQAAPAEEIAEAGTVSPVTLGGLDGSPEKRVVEESVAEEMAVAETASAMAAGTGTEIVEREVVEEVETRQAAIGELAAGEMKAPEVTEDETVAEKIEVPEGTGEESIAREEVSEIIAGETVAAEVEIPAVDVEDMRTGAAAVETAAVEEAEKPNSGIAPEPNESSEDPLPPPMKPEKILLGLQPNSLKLTRKANKIFAEFVETLSQYPKARVLVKGYVSSSNDTPENLQLSEKRAATVQQLLIKHGVAATQIEVKGMGIQDPIATNDTRAGRLKNRRVEIEVIDDGV
ncbi:MAG: OmpA family protein [Deltaproteobacteria bacterium]|nr:OmpA family protein [Deltaproteobacteria bacterium]MBW2659092.1 OmpA family protein [Deltaproteobacteria bacterium]